MALYKLVLQYCCALVSSRDNLTHLTALTKSFLCKKKTNRFNWFAGLLPRGMKSCRNYEHDTHKTAADVQRKAWRTMHTAPLLLYEGLSMFHQSFWDFVSSCSLFPCRNLGGWEPVQGFSFHHTNEPATSSQWSPETLEMGVFRECTGTSTQCLLFIPQQNVSIQFLIALLFVISTYMYD